MATITKKNTLYRVSNSNSILPFQIPFRIVGNSPNVDVLGSDSEVDNIAFMTSIDSENLPLTEPGYHSFASLPLYVSFTGVFDKVEISNVMLTEIKEL